MSKVTGELRIALRKALATRLRLFDAATARQRAREADREARHTAARGWTRVGLYERGSPGPD